MNSLPLDPRRRAVVAHWWRESYLGACWRRADTLDLPTAVLALGAQEVLCTAPMLVAMSAVMSRYHLGYVGGFLHDLLGLDASSDAVVRDLFVSTRTPDWSSLWTGLAVALVFYVAVATTTQRAVDAIWTVRREGWSGRWRRLVWVGVQVLVYGSALVVVRILHARHLPEAAASGAYAVMLGVSVGAFHLWGHHLLLHGDVRRRDLLPGSVAIGTGVLLLVAVSPVIMPSQITGNVADYGLVGAAFVLSLWAVTYSTIVVFGTLLGQVYVSRGRSFGRRDR